MKTKNKTRFTSKPQFQNAFSAVVMITLFPMRYLSQLKDLDMNAIVLGRHARLPSFRKLKPLGVWELKNATNYNHYVILTMYICDFRLLFYSSIYSVYSSCFSQINLMKTEFDHEVVLLLFVIQEAGHFNRVLEHPFR